MQYAIEQYFFYCIAVNCSEQKSLKNCEKRYSRCLSEESSDRSVTWSNVWWVWLAWL